MTWSSAVIANPPLATTFFCFLFTTIPISSYLSVTYTSLENFAINNASTELPPTDIFFHRGTAVSETLKTTCLSEYVGVCS